MSVAVNEPRVTTPTGPGWLAGGAYVLMLVGAVGAFFFIRWLGEGLSAPEPPPAAVSVAAPKAGQVEVVAHVLATLAAGVGRGVVLGRLLARACPPPVVWGVL